MKETKAFWLLQTVITFSSAIFRCLEIYKLSRVGKLSKHPNNYLSNINCEKTKIKVFQKCVQKDLFKFSSSNLIESKIQQQKDKLKISVNNAGGEKIT